MSCALCQNPLVLELDDSDDDQDISMSDNADNGTSNTVPDDVQLPCNCHTHWQCLLDAYDMTQCPACSRSIVSFPSSSSSSSAATQQQAQVEPSILVTLHNEGGVQEGLDIFPLLKEEVYLRAYPEERKCRAFMEFCRQGDHRAVAELLKSCDDEDSDDDEEAEDEEENANNNRDGDIDIEGTADPTDNNASPRIAQRIPPDQILRYQDPLCLQQSGLHAAVSNGHREVAWLLLLLASGYSELEFPALVYQEAASMGVMRESQAGKVDIRAIKDVRGRTAEDVAREEGGVVWKGWMGNCRLAMPRQSLSNNLQSY